MAAHQFWKARVAFPCTVQKKFCLALFRLHVETIIFFICKVLKRDILPLLVVTEFSFFLRNVPIELTMVQRCLPRSARLPVTFSAAASALADEKVIVKLAIKWQKNFEEDFEGRLHHGKITLHTLIDDNKRVIHK
jgi:hypothetical protein